MEEIDDFIRFRTADRWLRWYVDGCIVCGCPKKDDVRNEEERK